VRGQRELRRHRLAHDRRAGRRGHDDDRPGRRRKAGRKAIFASSGCGSCHTLKAAGSKGNVGPNLDALKPSEEAAEKQVANGGGGMPPFKGQLSAAQIKAVATFVADNAGK